MATSRKRQSRTRRCPQARLAFTVLFGYSCFLGFRRYHTGNAIEYNIGSTIYGHDVRQVPSLFPGDDDDEEHYVGDATRFHPAFNALGSAEAIATAMDHSSITAVLPVTQDSLGRLEETLQALINSDSFVSEVMLVCHADLHRLVLESIGRLHKRAGLSLNVLPLLDIADENSGVLSAAIHVKTEWTLILGTHGINQLDAESQDMLLHSFPVDVPSGPCGFVQTESNLTCLMPDEIPHPASFLLPPFVIPTEMAHQFNISAVPRTNIWSDLGNRISEMHIDNFGGSVVGTGHSDQGWCMQSYEKIIQSLARMSIQGDGPAFPETSPDNDSLIANPFVAALFIVVFSSLSDLLVFSPAACRLINSGYEVRVLITAASTIHDVDHFEGFWRKDVLSLDACTIPFDSFTSPVLDHPLALTKWFDFAKSRSSVVIISEDNNVKYVVHLARFQDTILVEIPREDLPFCEWMGTLTPHEWASWSAPKVEITIVTDMRPRSLRRLLSSLSSARYFGDSVDLRINLEQTADERTLQLVQDFQWKHGKLSLHRRIIHGGLLPAVVESWYPHSNNSYGLILEDDVELSPLFYAWAKMSLLRYRYGLPENRSPSLFGISLYQQKNLELRPEGRRSFDPRAFFGAHGLQHTHTPYLSQIPCSWGALYFPEHWREFHSYLAIRFSESMFSIDEFVVPNVRSNSWTKSWKKFFIELVYLRGYVMLYPNYENFISLSTNHLEVGSHVKDQPRNIYDLKKSLFELPLMELTTGSQSRPGALLDLPRQTLPAWIDLPIVDLLGSLSSEDTLLQYGETRQQEMSGCSASVGQRQEQWRYQAKDLFTCDEVIRLST